ncbi:MAG: ATP-utilizing protein [Nitrospira sp. HN-bin3]|uniref:ATP-dependent sacrificial sulfur transferase LarE n=1 Tax=Nitrospira cf. moscoviensis SBR1015 TaxID=96242 RepID=UPI000A09790B|nr:ATP-dependent sacrificial sulfur transferase LarE [Nitrospira cf. moscoviensis SBR1015]OQW30679.1 MAG: ATP-utilizing protein [Nitrospira sp. HN-bin3]
MQSSALQNKLHRLRALLTELGSAVVAYSGGIDSTFVLKVAHDQLGEKAVGITAVSPTFPLLELEAAKKVAQEIGARHETVHTDQLAIDDFVKNDADRCFHCKTDLYQLLGTVRQRKTAAYILDGTNLDDLGDDRPGMKAARELGVRSPLVEVELSKTDIRILAKELGLSNWDKPAAACLSSRIPRGMPITLEKLNRVEQAEAVLQREGLRHFRVRNHGDIARIEVAPNDLPWLIEPTRCTRITARLKELGFQFVTVDLDGYRPGGVSLG